MPLNVYYLDDEEGLCEIFVDYFSSKDVVVTAFTDPAKIIELSTTSPPDLLFVDYRLPGVTGDQVAKAMAASIPKYLVTGEISVNTEYKFKGVFSKPYNIEQIQNVLDNFSKLSSSL